MTRRNPRPWLFLPTALCAFMAFTPGGAGVSVGFDAESLNALLPALTVDEVAVPLGDSGSLAIQLKELEIRGFDPAAGEDGTGHILTALRLRVPALGIETPVEPRLSVDVLDGAAGSTLVLRFEEARLAVPVLGTIDVAAFLPPLHFPADNVFLVAGMQGDVRVRSRLAGVEMGRKILRFTFDLETEPHGGR